MAIVAVFGSWIAEKLIDRPSKDFVYKLDQAIFGICEKKDEKPEKNELVERLNKVINLTFYNMKMWIFIAWLVFVWQYNVENKKIYSRIYHNLNTQYDHEMLKLIEKFPLTMSQPTPEEAAKLISNGTLDSR